MRNFELHLCNWILVASSMALSGYFGWTANGGADNQPWATIWLLVCACVALLVSVLVRRASSNWAARNWIGFVLSAVMATGAILFNILTDYSSASVLRDAVMTQSDNENMAHEQAVAEVQRLETAMAALRKETAWRTPYEAPETYAALIQQQMQRVDRGANIYQRTKQCTDTTLPISSEVCKEIKRLEAEMANAQRRQVILAELKTLGEQFAIARSEVENHKKVSNPALAQVRSVVTWFRLDRNATEHSDWWGAKSIMLYMTILLTALITVLGWELGQMRPAMADERHSWRPTAALPPSPDHPPIPLKAETPPVSSNSTHTETVTYSYSGHDAPSAFERLRALKEYHERQAAAMRGQT